MIHNNLAGQGVVSDLMKPSLFRIESWKRESPDVFTMSFLPKDGMGGVGENPGFTFLPGQFNMIYIFGLGEVPISISGDPAPGLPLIHTTRSVGAVTQGMSLLRPGAEVGVRGPFGNHWPVERAWDKDLILVAGGIGLAPLRPVIYSVLNSRNKFGKVILLIGSKTPSEMVFRGELRDWDRSKLMEIHLTVDRGSKSWRGSLGVVTKFVPAISFEPENALAMICGPEVMMHFTIDALKKRGMQPEDIYVSMERNMKCAVGFCGHCQYGPHFICKNGPIFPYSEIEGIFREPEV